MLNDEVRNRAGRVVVGALIACGAATLAGGQSGRAGADSQAPPLTFRSSIEAVQVDVYVTDAAGTPVSGLTVDDFELVENGKPRPITTFEAVNIPIERAEPVERLVAEPDVLTNTGPAGRVYLFALDEVLSENILRTRRFVRQFIEEHFGPHDIGAVALLGKGLATDGQDFTNNRRLLLTAVDKFTGGGSREDLRTRRPTNQCAIEERLPGSVRTGRNGERLRGAGATGGANIGATDGRSDRSQQIQALRSLTEAMSRVPGRHKALVIFTECFDVDVLELVQYNGGVLGLRGEDAHAAMSAATRSNIAIYPIDPTGVSPDPDNTIPLETIGAFRSLAEATGGFALINSNSFTETFERIVRENSTYYMLAFDSGYEKNDGKYVKLEVRVRRPGLVVHARDGYVAPTREERRDRDRERARIDSPTAVALATPMATSGLPMRVTAAPFKGTGQNAAVALAVELDASSLGLVEKQGAIRGEFNVHYVATDARRNVYPEVGHGATVEIKVAPGGGRLPLERIRVRVLSETQLPAGRYQLRVVAGTGLVAGSVVYDLEVPDFGDAPLAMSGVAFVTSPEADVLTITGKPGKGGKPVKCYTERCATPTPGAAGAAKTPVSSTPLPPLLEGRLPGAPTTRREFGAGENVVLAVEVYDNAQPGAQEPPAVITLAADLRAADGTVVPLTSGAKSLTQVAGTHAFAVRLPLAAVPKGTYALRVKAHTSADAERVVTREIPIQVR